MMTPTRLLAHRRLRLIVVSEARCRREAVALSRPKDVYIPLLVRVAESWKWGDPASQPLSALGTICTRMRPCRAAPQAKDQE